MRVILKNGSTVHTHRTRTIRSRFFGMVVRYTRYVSFSISVNEAGNRCVRLATQYIVGEGELHQWRSCKLGAHRTLERPSMAVRACGDD